MNIYRIVPDIYVEDYTGKGASFEEGARWNLPGQPVLYFALSASVAMLEMANYFPSPRLIPKNRVLGIYSISDHIKYSELSPNDLPSDWADYPYPQSTQDIGAKWLACAKELFLKVPSVATPEGLESIIVVNPLHNDIDDLKFITAKNDFFNKRAFIGK
ncbi:MAG: RES family NAD+ phosphorylase [Alteromonadaceae bacterium]|nr:RES family NAD+ phosphorylase [Alteromonadaceae bacterium]